MNGPSEHDAQVLTIKNIHNNKQFPLEPENQINEQWNNHEIPQSTTTRNIGLCYKDRDPNHYLNHLKMAMSK